jgi:hypothetical protein
LAKAYGSNGLHKYVFRPLERQDRRSRMLTKTATPQKVDPISTERAPKTLHLASPQAPARGKTCPAIDGIIEEGSEILVEYKGAPAIDAGLVAAAQAVEHCEIARCGTLIAWAEQLGMSDAVELLEATLEEESATDEALSALGEGGVNERAMAEVA